MNLKSKCVLETFPQMCNIPICGSIYNSGRLFVMFLLVETVEMGGQHYSKDGGIQFRQGKKKPYLLILV